MRVPVSRMLPLIRKYHYTGSGSLAAVFAFGLIHRNKIVGGALWMAQRKSAAKSMWKGDHKKVLSLSRLAIAPQVPRNGASFLIAGCTRQIKALNKYDCLTTYADTSQGHTGAIYKACGWEFMGKTPKRPRWENKAGKITARKQGRRWRTVEEMNKLGYFLVSYTVKLKFRKLLNA